MTTLWRTGRLLHAVAVFFLLLGVPSSRAEEKETASVVVEHVTEKPSRRTDGVLGTTSYAPSEKEKPHFEKLAAAERETGGLAGDYDISKKDKTYVGWFGVVRKVTENKNETELLIEHKYFDGLTDTHILALSFNGSGDFRVTIPGTGHKIEPLMLVKVYGVASVNDAKSEPVIKATFARVWHWGTFTFLMASGEQRGSEQWRKLNTVDLDDIYEPYPDDAYYRRRLGKK
jgi:hypothetical protein